MALFLRKAKVGDIYKIGDEIFVEVVKSGDSFELAVDAPSSLTIYKNGEPVKKARQQSQKGK